MVAYSAASPKGPFNAATKNYVVLSGSCYFARFFRGPSMELLTTHQSYSRVGRTYIAPYKLVVSRICVRARARVCVREREAAVVGGK